MAAEDVLRPGRTGSLPHKFQRNNGQQPPMARIYWIIAFAVVALMTAATAWFYLSLTGPNPHTLEYPR